jgi:putative FmdB family regulatory protein
MPSYCYRCKDCEEQFEQSHSITVTLEDCHLCAGQGSLERIPSLTRGVTIHKTVNHKAGDVVKAHIEEARRDVKEEKRKASQEMVE